MSTPPLPDLVQRVRLLTDGGRALLGVTGAPGAGKSTFAARLAAAVGPAVVVPMDGFHLAQAELDRLGRADRKGAPDTFDAAGFVALLDRLRTQRPEEVVYAPTFDRHLEEPIAGALPIAPDVRLVVVEGNYLLHDDGAWAGVASQLDECWYVEIDEQVRVDRLIARHVAHGRSATAAREWTLGTDQRNATVIAGTRPRADVVVRLG